MAAMRQADSDRAAAKDARPPLVYLKADRLPALVMMRADDWIEREKRLSMRGAQLRAVREWMAVHAYEPGCREHVRELSDAIICADKERAWPRCKNCGCLASEHVDELGACKRCECEEYEQ